MCTDKLKPPETYYKVLNADGTCYHGGRGKWHLPGKNRPGKWMPKIKGELSPCSNGYHVLKADMLLQWIAPVAVFTVEYRGCEVWQDDKGVVEQARLLRRLPNWTEQTARLFACDCAEHLRESIPVEELAQFDVCLLTIRRYAFGLANDAELNQAMAGARARARAWAWAWAWARAGARAWAWAPEKEWNTKRLLEYINGEVDLEEIRQKVTP